MKLIIDIPEEMWERVKDGYVPLGISKYLKNGEPYDERPQGEWLISSSEFLNWECSLCHESNAFEDNFCPNCGAKMRKG